ncbi:MAG TPA: mechanosensitive ion channel [Candidatus Desulfobacillus sp.]|nr:mechanosensitive ion channel [Candidatus Desulfobacillus sp.]
MPNQIAALDQAQNTFIDLAVKFGPKVLVAVLIIVAGYAVGRWVGRFVDRWLGRLGLEPPVQLLIVRLARLAVLALFFVMALQNLGVDLLPLIAGLGVVGAGIALAMQGVLGNLAAGLVIIFTRPFRVGEYVSMVGVEGEVREIDLFSTRLGHPDRSVVVVPNRKIVGEILHNYGQVRQLDLSVTIARAADIERALALVNEVVAGNPRVLKEPAPVVGVAALGERAIGIAIKPWTSVADFLPAQAEINRSIVERLAEAGVDYPEAAREIRLVGALPAR